MAAIDDSTPVLAIYDFRSKQEYIYRTNRMREITGASELMAGMYRRFGRMEVSAGTLLVDGKETRVQGGHLRWDWDGEDVDKNPCEKRDLFDQNEKLNLEDGEVGIVVYEGGGNLCVLYRNRAEYVNANRAYSRALLESSYSLSLITGYATWVATGNVDADFIDARKRAYRVLDVNKRTGRAGAPCNTLPFTQVDAVTFQPIVEKPYKGADRVELSRESVCKVAAWQDRANAERKREEATDTLAEDGISQWEKDGKLIDDLVTSKDRDSRIAVVYFDGNSIGNRLKQRVHSIEDMRAFSHEVHDVLVNKTEEAMKRAIDGMEDERQRGFRVIVDHGDEITLICNAHAAPIAVQAYFEALAQDEKEHAEDPSYMPYHACAGIAFCHAHDPFSEVYRIAEECCESGKERNRSVMKAGGAEASYVDFHFCRSGITGSLRKIRSAQEEGITARPYRVDDTYAQFLKVGRLMSAGIGKDALVGSKEKVRRADVKALSRAIQKGDSWCDLELERMRDKDPDTIKQVEDVLLAGDSSQEARTFMRNVLFDVSSYVDLFDVLFSQTEGGEEDE